MSAFWGKIVKGNLSHVQEIPNDCNLVLTQAAIDRVVSEPSTLYIEIEGFEKLALCTLSLGRCEQARIDLLFDKKVKFSIVGKADIHLIGYMTENVDDFSDDEISDHEFEDDFEQEPTPKGKRKLSIEESTSTKKIQTRKSKSKSTKREHKESCR